MILAAMGKKSKWYLQEQDDSIFLYCEDSPVKVPGQSDKHLGKVIDITLPKKAKPSDGVTVSNSIFNGTIVK